MDKRTLSRQHWAGFSLVELLVATAITLIGLLVITQVFAVYEGWKRTTTGVAQTQESGLLGAFTIEQDLRNAGFGMIGLECAKISAYNANGAPSKQFELVGTAISISSDTPEKGSDTLGVRYSSSPYANVAARIQRAVPTSASVVHVDNGLGFAPPDLILIAQDAQPCSILQLSAVSVIDGQNVTGPGSSWKLPHDAAGAAPWNPPEGLDIFPAGGYGEGARVLNLGQLIDRRFYVANNTLRMDERSPKDGSVTSFDLIPGVIGLRALCLPATAPCNAQTTAVRFGLLVRSGNREKTEVSPAAIAYWPGVSLDLDTDARHYRYRVFQTIVPLKNIIWNK